MRQKTVLISEPNAADTPAPFLAYVWSILKSHWERHGDRDAYQWLDPIFHNDTPIDLFRPYQNSPIDVLGLSCYTWNWRIQCEIAQRVKAKNPQALVVAAGRTPITRTGTSSANTHT